MKKLLTVWALFICAATQAQDCGNYLFLQNNKTVEMTIYNKKAEPDGKQVYSVSNVATAGGITSATLNSEMFDKNGKSVAKSTTTVKCNGGIMMMDMRMNLSAQQQSATSTATANNVYIEYPSAMNVGDMLKDGSFSMNINTNGLNQNISMTITNRKVEAKEPVTTTAGTWDCYKITYSSKTVVKTAGIGLPLNMDGTEWYAPGVGVVKTESKYGGAAVTAIH